MDVSVIIVNYNTKQLLENCLNSIIEKTFDVDYEIIVVDNNSPESITDMINEKFGLVKLIESSENLGFGRANNLGAKHAKGKYMLFLNSDTIILNNAIKYFFDYLEHNDDNHKIGAVGCWLEGKSGGINNSFGYFPTIKNEWNYLKNIFLDRIKLSHLSKKQKINLKKEDKSEVYVDFIIGADIFIRNKTFKELNGFDPNFFMYYEETDLQKRMSKIGLERVVISTPRIIHLEGGSTGAGEKINFPALMMSQESFNYYIRKHFKGFQYLFFRLYNILERTLTVFFWKFSCRQYISYFLLLVFNIKANKQY